MHEAAVYVSPDELRPWSKNPRKNDPSVRTVIDSIKRFGFGAPIVANKNGEIIAGHTRWKAAKVMKLQKVPVRYMDLSDDDAHKLSLADNKLGELAEWDDAKLEKIIEEFDDTEKALLGFGAGKEVLDTSDSLIEETDAMDPEFYVIFRGPLELQADLIKKLQSLTESDPRIRIEPGI